MAGFWLHFFISPDCGCKSNGEESNSKQKQNKDECQRERWKPIEYHACKENYSWNPSVCTCEYNEKCEIDE